MSDTTAERFRRVAGTFTLRARVVSADAWENPAPCAGWTARDVVRHLVEWVPSVMSRADIAFPAAPSVDEDPCAAWQALADTLQAALDDPNVATRTFDAGPPGELTVEAAIGMLVVGDVLIHTWDLATAAGLDDRLDPVAVTDMLHGIEPLDDVLRNSGHYGPRVMVGDAADDQTRLIAFTGRQPTRS